MNKLALLGLSSLMSFSAMANMKHMSCEVTLKGNDVYQNTLMDKSLKKFKNSTQRFEFENVISGSTVTLGLYVIQMIPQVKKSIRDEAENNYLFDDDMGDFNFDDDLPTLDGYSIFLLEGDANLGIENKDFDYKILPDAKQKLLTVKVKTSITGTNTNFNTEVFPNKITRENHYGVAFPIDAISGINDLGNTYMSGALRNGAYLNESVVTKNGKKTEIKEIHSENRDVLVRCTLMPTVPADSISSDLGITPNMEKNIKDKKAKNLKAAKALFE